ncbi:thiamine phosphate synthase [Sutcliffiella halmapala]|uniref:thiamine phosphate synthase n=1 Tax=Sutcliffiella halmapala TaxID=79882 RepID=UPI00099587C4|nr:thiamine phosphate synthase [Sutcliffiella halmapala]
MNKMKDYLRLYLVMGSPNCQERDPVEVLQEAIDGGITLFQYREKGEHALTGEEKIRLGKALMNRCQEANIPFIVNDDVELALSLGADGVHIGQDDGTISDVRERMTGKLVGVSVHNVAEALEAVAQGVDYIGVGPMFFTNTKVDIQEVQGPRVIREIREAGILLPIVGIGGITLAKAPSVLEVGADGVAVISAITHAESPMKAARAFRFQHGMADSKRV